MGGNLNNSRELPVRVLCTLAFLGFTFCYLFFFQADLIAMEQHVLSGGMTHYNKTVGAILITLLLYLLQLFVRRVAQWHGGFYFLTFVPSLLLLIMLTSADDTFDIQPFSSVWTWLVPVLLCLYAYFVFFCRKKRIIGLYFGRGEGLFGCLWQNILCLSLAFLFVCLAGNSNEVLHYRLRMETLLSDGNYSEALEVGNRSLATDESLTMLRIYALSRSKKLGERLFEYPLTGGSEALLPNGKDVKCMIIPNSDITKFLSVRKKGSMKSMEYLTYLEHNGLAMKSVTDYILCGYLLDRNLDGFVNVIRRKYNLSSPSLPKHYREALTLYTHLRANPVVVFHSEIMDADYADFQKLEQSYTVKEQKYSYLKDSYGDTYWFYYFYK